jgi:hypothetical protein
MIKNKNKLSLTSETIKTLGAKDLAAVAGGDSALCANTQQAGCVVFTADCPTAKGHC